MLTITGLKAQKKDPQRVNVYVNDEFLIGIDRTLLIDLALFVGKEISEEERRQIIWKSEGAKAYEKCLRLIGKRPRSTQEIAQYLKQKKTDPSIIDLSIQKLSELNYVNDAEFADWWVRHRLEYKPKGKIALQQELEQKGIPKEIIREVLDTYDSDEENALALARKRLESMHEKDALKRKKKLADFLQRRGYSWQHITYVFKKLAL